jgi:hypothetical protein
MKSKHAPKQKQRRGIDNKQEELIRVFGDTYYAKGNAQLMELPRDFLQTVEKAMRTRLVVDENGELITAEHIIKGNKRRRKDRNSPCSSFIGSAN